MQPAFINKKSKIYLVAPSFGCTTSPYVERLHKAIEQLKSLGHEVVVGPNCFLAEGKCASNTPELRAKEFMDAYSSDADCIISVGGGEVMYEILDYIDFEQIKKLPPKWFVGFSDNTNLTFTLTTLCDVETVYGACAGHFHFKKYTYDVLDTYEMLKGKKEFKGYPKYESPQEKLDPFANYNLDTKKVITPYNYKEPFKGTILGGNLDIMQLLCGTPFDKVKEYTSKHTEGIIFYLEACDLNVVGIKRALLQLKRSGWFQNIKGFLVGRPLCIGTEFAGVDHFNAVIDVLSEYNVPILLDIDLGHIVPTLPFRNGACATVEYKKNNIFITYE
ncbi:MAG: LD-carboxypeptidase [Anaeroplasmataceae bacterium]|nr:LD-carboxypeptidase [Anaeroplasmataceae bacterium]